MCSCVHAACEPYLQRRRGSAVTAASSACRADLHHHLAAPHSLGQLQSEQEGEKGGEGRGGGELLAQTISKVQCQSISYPAPSGTSHHHCSLSHQAFFSDFQSVRHTRTHARTHTQEPHLCVVEEGELAEVDVGAVGLQRQRPRPAALQVKHVVQGAGEGKLKVGAGDGA